MKHIVSLALLIPLAGCTLPAQVSSPEPYPYTTAGYPPPNAVVAAPMLFTAEQLDQLLGPIALYPDALLALMLPASTNPSDIVLAARYLQAGGNPDQVEEQPWDDAVRGLAHYPQVVRWMDENLVWTKQLGQAFATQSADVMNAVQRLRSRAQAAGNLLNTPQQQVVYEGGTIMIVPTQPDVIYVPYYDPTVVYVPYGRTYYSPSFFGFSSGFAAGWWLSYGLDWGHHRVWTIDRNERERYWREHRHDWHRPPNYVHLERSPGFRSWEPHGPRSPQHTSPSRPVHVTQPTPHDRRYDHRDDRRNGPDRDRGPSAATTTPVFVGPTAMRSPLPQPLPTPATVPPLRQVNPPPASTHHYDRPGSQGGRGDRGPTRPSPSPVVGPMPPPQTHHYRPPVQAAPAPRPAPALPRYTPSAAPAPRPAPPLQRYTPPPAPAPQAQPAPAQQQQQSQSSSNEDERRRPPFVRPMR